MMQMFLFVISFLGLHASIAHGAALESATKVCHDDEFTMHFKMQNSGLTEGEMILRKDMTWLEMENDLEKKWQSADAPLSYRYQLFFYLFYKKDFDRFRPSKVDLIKLKDIPGLVALLADQKKEKSLMEIWGISESLHSHHIGIFMSGKID